MHPPFFPVGRPVAPSEIRFRPARSVPRRSAPCRLDLTAPAPGFPPIPLAAPAPPRVTLAQLAREPGFAPAPRRPDALRRWLGARLIHLGQHLAKPPRPA